MSKLINHNLHRVSLLWVRYSIDRVVGNSRVAIRVHLVQEVPLRFAFVERWRANTAKLQVCWHTLKPPRTELSRGEANQGPVVAVWHSSVLCVLTFAKVSCSPNHTAHYVLHFTTQTEGALHWPFPDGSLCASKGESFCDRIDWAVFQQRLLTNRLVWQFILDIMNEMSPFQAYFQTLRWILTLLLNCAVN